MSNFKKYKPAELEYNVQVAVENIRKAYSSNETEKIAKHFTKAEDIIILAVCCHGYTLCKESTLKGYQEREEAERERALEEAGY